MLVAVQHQIRMDLIGDDLHAVAEADLAHRPQLFGSPHPAHGVVGVAEDEESAAPGFFLKVREVHGVIASVIPLQRADHQLTAGVQHHVGEGMVHRLLNEDLVAGLCKHGQDHPHAGHHAGGERHLFHIGLPAVALFLPAGNGLKVFGRPPGVAENALVRPGLDGVHDAGRCAEIHVRDPQGDHIIGPVVQLCLLKFGRIILGTVYDLVKIEFHVSCLPIVL